MSSYLIKVVGGIVEGTEADETSVGHLSWNSKQAALDQVQAEEGDDGTSAYSP